MTRSRTKRYSPSPSRSSHSSSRSRRRSSSASSRSYSTSSSSSVSDESSSRHRDRYRGSSDRRVKRRHRSKSRNRNLKKRENKRSNSRNRSRSRRSRHQMEKSRESLKKRESRKSSSGIAADEEEFVREMENQRRKDEETETLWRKQQDAKDRGSRTIMVGCISLTATERNVFEIFSKKCGKVRDAKVIRDTKTGRSKGVAYVEFEDQESVGKALLLVSSDLAALGPSTTIQPSQWEKNAPALSSVPTLSFERPSANVKGTNSNSTGWSTGSEICTRLYIGGSGDVLGDLTEGDIQNLFSPLGRVEFVDLHRRGGHEGGSYAFVQFANADEARLAMKTMNGFMIAGRELKIGLASAQSVAPHSNTGSGANQRSLDIDLIDDMGDGPSVHLGLLKDNLQRSRLMRALVREPITTSSSVSVAAVASGVPIISTPYIRLRHMWLVGDQLLHDGGVESFFSELGQDVQEEAAKFGTVHRLWIDEISSDGDIYLQLGSSDEAGRCIAKMDKRWFGGRQIQVQSVPEADWARYVPKK